MADKETESEKTTDNSDNELHRSETAENATEPDLETYDDSKSSIKEESVEKDDDNSEDEEIVIIYKKERNPIVKFVLGFVSFVVIAYVSLFAIGFTMGLMKIQPPNIDEQVLSNKWSELTGNEEETPSELEPAEKVEE